MNYIKNTMHIPPGTKTVTSIDWNWCWFGLHTPEETGRGFVYKSSTLYERESFESSEEETALTFRMPKTLSRISSCKSYGTPSSNWPPTTSSLANARFDLSWLSLLYGTQHLHRPLQTATEAAIRQAESSGHWDMGTWITSSSLQSCMPGSHICSELLVTY